MSHSGIYRIRCSFARFKKGWLHEEVINGYMHILTQENDNSLCCSSTEAMIIENKKDFSRLWFNQNLENIKRVITPFNPTYSHWILLLLDINSCELFILDPLGKLCEGSRNFESCHNVAAGIFNDKFAMKIFGIKPLQYVQQTDSFNCGMFVCCYMKQILPGEYFL